MKYQIILNHFPSEKVFTSDIISSDIPFNPKEYLQFNNIYFTINGEMTIFKPGFVNQCIITVKELYDRKERHES